MLTYHLAPAADWAALSPSASVIAPSLVSEGFIHCTTGADEMVATASRHYLADPRSFVVLTIDLDRVGVPWRYDSADTRYPHIYGQIPRDAVLAVRPIPRAADGTFLPFHDDVVTR